MPGIWLLFALCLLISTVTAQDGFTCQGPSRLNGLSNCPDRGSQRGSAGGNVTAYVRWANNMPNKDFSGPSAKVSDPYVLFTRNGVELGRSSVINNDLNPVWNEEVNLGFLLSADDIIVQIWDYDIGVEGDDDLLVSGGMRVPFCSTFNSNMTTSYCNTPFGCSVDDSSWATPSRQMCREKGIVSFVGGINCLKPGGMCLFLDMIIVPFQFNVALTNKHTGAIGVTPILGAAGPPSAAQWSTQYNFGSPFAYENDEYLDMNVQEFKTIRGALMMRMYQSEKYFGKANAPAWYGAVNFPAVVYVCRREDDNLRGVPPWLLQAPWSGRNSSVIKVKLSGGDKYYGCYFSYTEGTIRNKWGGVKSGAIMFGTNTIDKHDRGTVADQTFYQSHYIVLAVPQAAKDDTLKLDIIYDVDAFITSLLSYGLIWAWLAFLVTRLLVKINFRLDRLSTWLISNTPGGEKIKSPLVGALFLSYQQTPCNVDYRGHLYHSTNAVLFLCLLPNLLLIGWGFSCAASVSPTSLGLGIVFVGIGATSLFFGMSLWEASHWRLSYVSMAAIGLSVILFFCFMISTIFVDNAVVLYGHDLNFAALSTMFGTLNAIPLLLLVFKEDRTYKKNMGNVLNKMTDAVFKFNNKDRKGKDKNKSMESTKILQTLLGKCYTINPNIPLFKYSPIMYDPEEEEEVIDPNSEFEDPNANHFGDPLYNTSLLCLFIYFIIATSRTSYSSLSLLNCLVLILLDNIHSSLAKGDNKWTPGYKIALLVLGRLIIMSASETTWVLHYSVAYLIYALAMTNEMINTFLPLLSRREAGEIVHTGRDASQDQVNYNVASTSFFNLGLLTLAFTTVMMVGAYGDIADQLPSPKIFVFGSWWSVYTFGVIAMSFCLCGGLIVATARSFYLEKHGLLRGWARNSFMFSNKITVPIMLSIFTEFALLFTGVLIFAITKETVILILAVFLPLIIVTMGYAYKEWLKNDYILVVWPPVEATLSLSNSNPDDLEVAFNMIENLFGEEQKGDGEGPETDGVPEEVTLKGFKLPALTATGNTADAEIKMPPLPLKSVLRRKRANLGIKTKSTTIKQGNREGVDGDKIGNDNDEEEGAAVDPWADFMGGDNESKYQKEKRLKVKPKYEMKSRGGFMNLPMFLYADDYLSNYSSYTYVKKQLGACMKALRKRVRKWTKIKLTEDDEDGDIDSDNDDDDDANAHEDLTKMGFWTAVLTGYLTKAEYIAVGAWLGGMLSICLMGVLISNYSEPSYLGNIIWVVLWIVILTYVCLVKYFNSFVVDQTMKEALFALVVLHFAFSFTTFTSTLNSDIGIAGSLWILDYFFYYPVFVYMFVEFVKWREMGYIIIALDNDGDGQVTMKEYIEYFQAYPAIFIMLIVLTWQFYLWIGVTVGKITLIFMLLGITGYVFVRDWAINDFFLSPELSTVGTHMIKLTLVITLFIAVTSSDNPFFSLSVFFFTLIAKEGASMATRMMIADSDIMIFFSPFMFPVYSYDPKTNDVVNETDFAKKLVNLLLVGAGWGAVMCAFVAPINIGVLLSCIFLMAIAAIVAFALSYVPQQLGKYASMISPDGVVEAAKMARLKFADRRKPLIIEMKGYEGEVDKHAFEPKKLTSLQKLKEMPSIELAIDNTSETRALTHVHDDTDYVASKTTKVADEFKKVSWIMEQLSAIWASVKKVMEFMPKIGTPKGWARHSESLFSFSDMLAEAVVVGKGPIGWIGMDGQLFKLFKWAQDQPKLTWLQQPWLNAYDEFGNNRTYALLSEHIETKAILERFLEYDEAINFVCEEETRCAVHFIVLTMVSAEAKLQREQVLFQKFLRENRFRLASNGITPPAEIFTSTSYASVDIALVAVWLSTLSQEERDRFHMLKATFSDEQKERDKDTDAADSRFLEEARILEEDRHEHDQDKVEAVQKVMMKKQADKVTAWADTLHPTERSAFNIRREDWTSNSDCFVHFKEQSLYEKYKEHCVSGEDDSIMFGRAELADLEACLKDSRLGEYGRSYQFVDSDFPPGDASIGASAAASQVLGWRCAPGIVDEVHLFSNGSDPNDVNAGIFDNQWLLSAISMIAASGGGGVDGKIVKGIADLFIGHTGVDGEITHNTEVGAFCLRLFKKGVWCPVVVDDLFPLLLRDNHTNANRGLAGAHAFESSSIWVNLIEKACAKFYGSYGELSKGYVHHSLQDLTGSEAECITLSAASRGAGKRSLWDSIVKWEKNGYIIGAGTGSAELVDKELKEMGVTFNSSYPVYSAWAIDGLKILKLRNPPGHHEQWKGDWGVDSPLWTSRLRYKLGFNPEDKDVFYMSFDDFCNVFRYLYVCKYYDPTRWTTLTVSGIWKKAQSEEEYEEQQKALKNQSVDTEEKEDPETRKRMKAMAKVDTSGGLPSVDNPGCVLENNPHYSLKIFRPTEVRIQVSQSDSRGKVSGDAHPFSILICRNLHPTIPLRLSEIGRTDVVARCDKVTDERVRYLYAALKPGLYQVLISTYVAGLEGTFTVKVISNYRLSFESVWPPRWMIAQEQNSDDIMRELAIQAQNEFTNNLKKIGKKGLKIFRELFGVQMKKKSLVGANMELEKDEDSDEDSDDD